MYVGLSEVGSLAYMAGSALLKTTRSASLPAVSVLVIVALPLAGIWYMAIQMTSYPIMDELHKMAARFGVRPVSIKPVFIHLTTFLTCATFPHPAYILQSLSLYTGEVMAGLYNTKAETEAKRRTMMPPKYK